ASRDLSVQPDLQSLYRTLMERVTALVHCTSSSVFLYDIKAGEVEVAASSQSTLVVGQRFRLDQGMTGRLARTCQAMLVNDYQTWKHRIPELAAKGVRAVLMVPMTCGGELVGALGVSEYSDNRIYSEADVRVLSLFAAHAASTIRSAQLLEEARSRASELQREHSRADRVPRLRQGRRDPLGTQLQPASARRRHGGRHRGIAHRHHRAQACAARAARERSPLSPTRRIFSRRHLRACAGTHRVR